MKSKKDTTRFAPQGTLSSAFSRIHLVPQGTLSSASSRIHLVIFDWNGTLLSDASACVHAVNEVLKVAGAKTITLDKYREDVTTPVNDLYVKNGCDANFLDRNALKLSKVFHESYEARASKCRTRKGARELLKWLRENDIESIIVSNHTLDGLHSQFERLGLSEYVSEIKGNLDGHTVLHTKNKLERVRDYMKENSYKNNEVLIVGDSLEEIELGHELGIVSVAISGGFFATHRLRELKPDYLISNLLELKDIITKIK